MTVSHPLTVAVVSATAEPYAADATTLRPAARAPSWAWALRRTAMGLVIMIAVTSFAAIIAQASIEASPEQTVIATPPESGIAIGLPAVGILRR
jgi:hypothetical protein